MPKRVTWSDRTSGIRMHSLTTPIAVGHVPSWIARRRPAWQRGCHDPYIGDPWIETMAPTPARVLQSLLIVHRYWSGSALRHRNDVSLWRYNEVRSALLSLLDIACNLSPPPRSCNHQIGPHTRCCMLSPSSSRVAHCAGFRQPSGPPAVHEPAARQGVGATPVSLPALRAGPTHHRYSRARVPRDAVGPDTARVRPGRDQKY